MIKEYFLSVISASFAAGLLSMLSPQKGGLGKYVKFFMSLALVLSIIWPLRGTMNFLLSISEDPLWAEEMIDEGMGEYTERTNELIIEKNTDIICAAIKKELKDKLDIPSHECDITLEFEKESGEMTLSKVNVFLFGYSMWKNPKDIKSLVFELTGSECEVIAG